MFSPRQTVLWVSLVLCLSQISFAADSRIQWSYNRPPDDHPDGYGLRAGLIKEIEEAESSLEGSFYQINDPFVIQALINAVDRGVSVTLTSDTDWIENDDYAPSYQKLVAGGVTLVPDKKRDFNHNKYCIIDRGTDRARVWMGSYNITTQCGIENGNASFLFMDPFVADIFYADFSQMGEEGKFQNAKGGVFLVDGDIEVVDDTAGPAGLDYKDFQKLTGEITYPSVDIDDTHVEFYFSPLHNIQKRVVELLYSAQESIHFGMYTLDNAMIYQTIMNKAESPFVSSSENIFPVALRQDPWQNTGKWLRAGDGENFSEEPITKEAWTKWQQDEPDLFGNENKGLFHNTASYFYPDGETGGEIHKVPVYGVLNWLGLSKGPYKRMIEMGINVRKTALPGNLHHKFIIIDRKILILGSYNFSTTAETRNDESAIVIHDPEIVEGFYQTVFRPMYMNAYPEYFPGDEELEEYNYEAAPIAISEIHFVTANGGKKGKYVELYNYAECDSEEECEELTVNLKGWKLWNGLVPLHEEERLRGSVDTLISYYNDPYTNKHKMNHPQYGYFLNPELERLRPQEYALIVSSDFDLSYLDPYLEKFADQFEQVYGREPETEVEQYPKLFIGSRPGDNTVGDNLSPYQFLTLYYPDQFTVADRFEHNLSFQVADKDGNVAVETREDLLSGNTKVSLSLKKGQSLERRFIDVDTLFGGGADVRGESYDGGDYKLIWYGLEWADYNEPNHWEPNRDGGATPGFGYPDR